jgi:hypothetical protein
MYMLLLLCHRKYKYKNYILISIFVFIYICCKLHFTLFKVCTKTSNQVNSTSTYTGEKLCASMLRIEQKCALHLYSEKEHYHQYIMYKYNWVL